MHPIWTYLQEPAFLLGLRQKKMLWIIVQVTTRRDHAQASPLGVALNEAPSGSNFKSISLNLVITEKSCFASANEPQKIKSTVSLKLGQSQLLKIVV
jgi:hypothetical protein